MAEPLDGTTVLDPNRFAYSSPGGPHQCYEYPRDVYHKDEPPKTIGSEAEWKVLEAKGWSKKYIPRDFPKMMYKDDGSTQAVNTPEEASKLGAGWSDKPPKKEAKDAPPKKEMTLQDYIRQPPPSAEQQPAESQDKEHHGDDKKVENGEKKKRW